ncbi:hypothetical protein Q4517_11705 [Tenacibaculum sp. 1_MG-2023]|uniref:hypothetical protein n=1 Tax=Tenacibaculum sp. 1_MG-2023 TaxID=3062653 RepID=UPI0026E490CA|nr:hypothetical protein [Tenacibaculum sp. 1_MG-2023]MDO6676210.1 hypothetical protein [Tenacibaculum sp. 1_MG-2023]
MVGFTRKITHQDYKNPEKLKKYYHRVEKKIYVKPRNSVNNNSHRLLKHNYMGKDFVYYHSNGTVIPFLGGGISLILVVFLPFSTDAFQSIGSIIFYALVCAAFIFFLIYGLTKPKKEQILNRRDGLITMTGFFWQKSITMSFKKVEFAYSTGGENMIGAFMLEAIRPNKWQTFDSFGYGGAECYESMSFITWYMDKNRPLPPGDAFDPYREEDFERRKAEGFPKPLYPSKISTPEATKEQQAERKRIGGW